MSICAIGSFSHQSQVEAIGSVYMKHSLLYIEIRVGLLLHECLQKIANSQTSDHSLQKAVVCYKAIDTQLYPDPVSSSRWCEWDHTLEGHLADLYLLRFHLTERLQNFLKQWEVKKLLPFFEEIVCQLDHLICFLNSGKNLDDKVLRGWEEKVDRFQEFFFAFCDRQRLQLLWGTDHPKLIRKVEILSLYLSWEQVLQKESSALFLQLQKTTSLYTAIKIKTLVTIDKKWFFRNYFQDKQAKRAVARLSSELQCADSLSISSTLVSKIKQAKERILQSEKHLMSKINRLSYVVSTIACFFLDNPYLRRASFFIESQEKITLQWQKIPVLSTPLDSSYLDLSKVMTGCGLFGLDLMQWSLVGVSQTMLQMMSQPFNLSINSWISCFQKIGCDEKVALDSLPFVDIFFECASFTAINGYTLGLNTSAFWQVSLSYCLGLTAVALAGKSVDLIYTYTHGKPAAASSYSFIRGMTQIAVFPFVSTCMTTYFLPHQIPYSGHIFENRDACKANQPLCRKEACKMLGLSETATSSEIKKIFRELAMRFHPDHNPQGSRVFVQLTAAKNACLTSFDLK